MLRITVTKKNLLTVGRRGFQTVGRETIEECALAWWQRYLPLHFQMIGFIRYKFASRLQSTNRKKRERLPFLEGVGDQTPAIGQVLPGVFSGRSRDRVLAHPNIKAAAPNFETYHAEVIMDAPAWNFTVGKRIDVRDEVTRDTPQETQTLEKIFAKGWVRRLRALGLRAPRVTKPVATAA